MHRGRRGSQFHDGRVAWAGRGAKIHAANNLSPRPVFALSTKQPAAQDSSVGQTAHRADKRHYLT